MRYVVTGGSGYVGAHLVKRLAERDETERVLIADIRPPRAFPEKADHITLDVRESGPLSEVRGAARDVVSPVGDAAHTVFSPVGDWIDGVTRSTSLKKENARLKRQLDEARGHGPS